MRTEEDIIRVKLSLAGTVELDFERIEADPTWRTLALNYQLPQEMAQAVLAYIQHYILRERFLREMPSTNGPGELQLIQMEEVNGECISTARVGQEQSGSSREA